MLVIYSWIWCGCKQKRFGSELQNFRQILSLSLVNSHLVPLNFWSTPHWETSLNAFQFQRFYLKILDTLFGWRNMKGGKGGKDWNVRPICKCPRLSIWRAVVMFSAFGGINTESSVRSCFEKAGDVGFIEVRSLFCWHTKWSDNNIFLLK
jgi:hypothetical protein